MSGFLARLIAPAPRCGQLCREVQEELATMRLSDALREVARRQSAP
ncbi:hypothetical protein KZZ07_15910 [Mameliella sp. CS4]|nr:hypothetical protein [Mameliella sp. CS4]MBW4984028.1 hypothetical protein [Mameliella sp. CS4]